MENASVKEWRERLEESRAICRMAEKDKRPRRPLSAHAGLVCCPPTLLWPGGFGLSKPKSKAA